MTKAQRSLHILSSSSAGYSELQQEELEPTVWTELHRGFNSRPVHSGSRNLLCLPQNPGVETSLHKAARLVPLSPRGLRSNVIFFRRLPLGNCPTPTPCVYLGVFLALTISNRIHSIPFTFLLSTYYYLRQDFFFFNSVHSCSITGFI